MAQDPAQVHYSKTHSLHSQILPDCFVSVMPMDRNELGDGAGYLERNARDFLGRTIFNVCFRRSRLCLGLC